MGMRLPRLYPVEEYVEYAKPFGADDGPGPEYAHSEALLAIAPDLLLAPEFGPAVVAHGMELGLLGHRQAARDAIYRTGGDMDNLAHMVFKGCR